MNQAQTAVPPLDLTGAVSQAYRDRTRRSLTTMLTSGAGYLRKPVIAEVIRQELDKLMANQLKKDTQPVMQDDDEDEEPWT